MHDSKKSPDRDAEHRTTQVDFLQSDLALCSTLAELANAKHKTGDREAAARLLEKAEKGYASIEQFLSHIVSAQARNEIQQKLKDLRATLDSVKQLL